MLERPNLYYDEPRRPAARVEAPACEDPVENLASLNLKGGWSMHFYRSKKHELRDILAPAFWRTAIDRNFMVGDTITCFLGEIGERTIVELGVVSVNTTTKQVEVSIISRHKETAVSAEHFADDGPKSKARRA